MTDDEFWCAVYLASIPQLLASDSFLRANDAAALKTAATAAGIVASSALAKRALQFGAQGGKA